MGYSGNPTTGATDDSALIFTIVAFVAVALYSALELNITIFSTFRRFNGLYFWSFLAASNGIFPHSIGTLLKNVANSCDYAIYTTLISVGWVPMVTGQSLVLYSRLHLIFWDQLYLRMVLGMIITNTILVHIPVILLMFGANSSPDNQWIQPYYIYQKVQVSVFFAQELIISAIYIKSCFSFFDVQHSLYGDAVRRMRRHLLWVNLAVVLVDIPMLCLEYAGYCGVQMAYKGLVYSVKLKVECRILNQLVEMTNKRHEVDPFQDYSTMQPVSSGSTTC